MSIIQTEKNVFSRIPVFLSTFRLQTWVSLGLSKQVLELGDDDGSMDGNALGSELGSIEGDTLGSKLGSMETEGVALGRKLGEELVDGWWLVLGATLCEGAELCEGTELGAQYPTGSSMVR